MTAKNDSAGKSLKQRSLTLASDALSLSLPLRGMQIGHSFSSRVRVPRVETSLPAWNSVVFLPLELGSIQSLNLRPVYGGYRQSSRPRCRRFRYVGTSSAGWFWFVARAGTNSAGYGRFSCTSIETSGTTAKRHVEFGPAPAASCLADWQCRVWPVLPVCSE